MLASEAGKGGDRRTMHISQEEWDDRYDLAFGKKDEPESEEEDGPKRQGG